MEAAVGCMARIAALEACSRAWPWAVSLGDDSSFRAAFTT